MYGSSGRRRGGLLETEDERERARGLLGKILKRRGPVKSGGGRWSVSEV